MLFIDARQRMRSVPEAHIPVPFFRENLRHDLVRVRALFAPYRSDCMFIQALADELVAQLSSLPRALPYPAGVIDEGERAIADGQIGVASALLGPVELRFDRNQPTASHGSHAVMFASPAVAADFLSAVLKGSDNRAALASALEHPAGERYPGLAVGGQADGGAAAISPDDAATLVQRGAALLTRRYLVLLPRDLSRQRLRVAWLERWVPSMVAGGASASSVPVRAAPPPPPLPRGPMSVLPDPPVELTPQAQTLIEAAKNGTPFCEECARRAAELAGV